MIKKPGVLAFLVILGISLLIGCSFTSKPSGYGQLEGSWENDERTLGFDSKRLVTISYKTGMKIKAMRGTYTLKDSTISFGIDEYSTSDNEWISTGKTGLKGYTEKMHYSILDDVLTTDIMATGIRYVYRRSK